MSKIEKIEKIELKHEYSFGKELSVRELTLGEETKKKKKVIHNNGAGTNLYMIMASCGLTEDEAGSIFVDDANKIAKAIKSFQ